MSSFSLSLYLDSSEGNQAVHSLAVFPNQVFSIQIFGKDIQSLDRNDSIRSANSLSVRFEYGAIQAVYEGFAAGNAQCSGIGSGTSPIPTRNNRNKVSASQ